MDLRPLFHWWTNRHGDRPLSAWVHVTGTITATNGSDWVVAGRPEESSARHRASGDEGASQTGPPHFILRHPPVQELADFQNLRDQLNQANAQRSHLEGELASAKSGARQVQRSTRGAARALALADLRQVEQADNDLLKALSQQIGTLKGKLAAYPNPDHYEVDALALDTGGERDHLPVYDHGYVVKSP